MNERTLRAFVWVARFGRMDRAAETLRYSAPAVSYQIRTLEKDLGARLFERSKDGLRLTRYGSQVLPVVREVLSLIDGMREPVKQGAQGVQLQVAASAR
jgi:DNA-binding transcriptional LysR family regulator